MLKNFLKDENGQGMVEYALIIALIAILLVVALTGVKDKLDGKFGEIETALDGGGASSGASSAASSQKG